jgi:hypothetical protein
MKTIRLTAAALLITGFILAGENPVSGIKLISFEAIQNGAKIDFKWVTSSINNAMYFIIEKSSDGKNFEELMKVQGSPHCYPNMEYFDTDYAPTEGKTFYRLKHVNTDGEVAIFNTVPVNFSIPIPEVSLMQEKGTEDLSLSLKGFEGKDVLVVLRDMKGNEFYSKMFLTATKHHIVALDPESKIPSGNYIITASVNNKIYSKKVVVR